MMEEDRISEDILGRFNNVKLVDKYEAYEIFKTNYDSIAGDIELIQAEGKDSVRQVDPNMVIKKKNGKDTEVFAVAIPGKRTHLHWRCRINPVQSG